jgi:multisubunit Na+/H+ antiporter MnhF subunit
MLSDNNPNARKDQTLINVLIILSAILILTSQYISNSIILVLSIICFISLTVTKFYIKYNKTYKKH